MKKVLLIAAVALFGFKASAQTEQGNIILGGTVDFETGESKADGAKSYNYLDIIPSVGYFVKEDLAIGTGVGVSHYKSQSGYKETAFVVSPFGRYYKNLGSEQFKFFGQLSVPMAFGTEKNSDGDKIGSSTSIGVELAPGFAFFPTKKFGIELGFNGIEYNNYTSKDADGDKIDSEGRNSFRIGADFFSPRLGLQFYF